MSAPDSLTSEEKFPHICPDCGANYFVSKPEYRDDPSEVCQKCFDAFNGMTLDQLFDKVLPHV